jgi:mono/diheme cytochrome c family protein
MPAQQVNRKERPPVKTSAAFAVVLALAVSIAVLAPGATAPAAAAAAPDGKAVFLAQKCNLCHSVQPAGIERTSKAEKTKGPDLAGVGKRHDAAWIKRWLARQEQMNGKKHLLPFKGKPEEMEAVVAWLMTQ